MSTPSLNCDKPGKVTHVTSIPLEVESADEKKLRKQAESFLGATKKLQTDYFKLCSHIRDRQMEPGIVRRILLSVGFHKAKVAEFLKVSYVSDEIWLEYKAKTIGFKLALEAARDEKGGKTHNPKTRLRNRLLAIAHKFEDAALFLEDKDLALIVPDIERRLTEGKDLTFENSSCRISIQPKGAK